jgi:outer membrane beta-barrel protein
MSGSGRLVATALLVVLASSARAKEVAPAAAAPARAAEEPAAPPAAAPDAPGAPATGKSATDEGIGLTLQDRIKAVSRKQFIKRGRFELAPFGGMTTNDAFFRSWSVGLRADYHFNDAFALELGGAGVLVQEKLDAVDQLRKLSHEVNNDARLLGYADLGVTFSPVYGKLALLSDYIVQFDGFIIAGVGATFDSNTAFAHPAMDVGVGARIFLSRWFVVRTDVKDYIYPQDRQGISTLQNLLLWNVGVGIFIPFDFQYEYEAAKVNG